MVGLVWVAIVDLVGCSGRPCVGGSGWPSVSASCRLCVGGSRRPCVGDSCITWVGSSGALKLTISPKWLAGIGDGLEHCILAGHFFYVNCASSLSLLVLETIHRVLQCSNANYDWSVTSVEALSHRKVILALPPSPCMHVSLLYQTNSLEYQLQLQEAANHRHRLGILIYLNIAYCMPRHSNSVHFQLSLYVFHWH